jgi:hypothetical protein
MGGLDGQERERHARSFLHRIAQDAHCKVLPNGAACKNVCLALPLQSQWMNALYLVKQAQGPARRPTIRFSGCITDVKEPELKINTALQLHEKHRICGAMRVLQYAGITTTITMTRLHSED